MPPNKRRERIRNYNNDVPERYIFGGIVFDVRP